LGPKKNKNTPPKKTKKKTITPMEYKPNKHLLPFLSFPPFKEPYNPEIPSSKKTILPIYAKTKPVVKVPYDALSRIFFL